jgi:hypothetical protein
MMYVLCMGISFFKKKNLLLPSGLEKSTGL